MKKFATAAFVFALLFSSCKDKPKSLPAEMVKQPVKDTIATPVQAAPVAPAPKPEDKYFLIAGSFLKADLAEAYKTELEHQGYQSQVVQRNWGPNSEYFRVAYKAFHDKSAAYNELNIAINEEGKTVWLLVK
ncbi:SPOR domain-containing protein [Mangrovibacterium lignilyticum]|uniref:SPOR domain-containing protein n=1 Tax=Mangrovibacterium lignilyticum TaxID=2668052 RepID=UPI0013D72D9F|nr:SPOR domain-containing protein [Mangrovibacterium lignilyticum]